MCTSYRKNASVHVTICQGISGPLAPALLVQPRRSPVFYFLKKYVARDLKNAQACLGGGGERRLHCLQTYRQIGGCDRRRAPSESCCCCSRSFLQRLLLQPMPASAQPRGALFKVSNACSSPGASATSLYSLPPSSCATGISTMQFSGSSTPACASS